PTDQKLIGSWLQKHGEFDVAYAQDGRQALEWLQHDMADVVVTDMQMPHINGLELVDALREKSDTIPVVLITAHGSERLASQALQRGASSYVPKSRFQEILVDTVRGIVDLKRADDSFSKSFRQAQVCDIQFVLDNDFTLVPPLIETVQSIVHSMNICDAHGRLQVGIALEQAIHNAIFHGNLGLGPTNSLSKVDGERDQLIAARRNQIPYRDRRVFVQLRVTDEEARLTVRDEGAGFEVRNLSKLDVTASMSGPTGRGFVLMWALMDQVLFNKSGNQVTLVKKRETPAPVQRAIAPMRPPRRRKLRRARSSGFGKLTDAKTGAEIKLNKQRLLVGRDPECDIQFTDSCVSRKHCVLFVFEGWWFVQSLRESNNVRVNQSVVTQSRIAPGAVLSIGNLDYVIDYDLESLGASGSAG
ncbi:MAG: response regulator, partial [Planctomycetales bacterium]|nr:response regulator [Planctomycetales bacterium]